MQILLVEDDQALADSLTEALRREGFTTNHVASGRAAILAAETDTPDLVILDLGLPDMDGLDVLKQLQKSKTPLLVLVLTARNTTEDKVSGLNRGADDYLAKPFEMSELLARLRALERRTALNQATGITIGPVTLDTVNCTASLDGKVIDLARREFMLLKALMENPGRVLSRNKLESSLYSWGEELASNSIDVHIHHLRKKISTDFIRTIRGIGYTIRDE